MPTIVFQTNAKGIKYAYESTSYWDKERKKNRTRRRYLGKVDPETGEIIPAKSKNTKNTAKAPCTCDGGELCKEIELRDEEIKQLREQLEALKAVHKTALDKLEQIAALALSANNEEK